MPAPISVVIPTLNSSAELPELLASLMEGLEAGILREVVLTDGGSDEPLDELADAVGARLVSGPKGRGGQLSRGADEAKGEWLLFLHSDSMLSAGWTKAVAEHLKDPKKAGYFRLQFDEKSIGATLTANWANLRSRWFQLPFGDQGLLISRSLFEQVGGYSDIPLMEDVAIARTLKGHLAALNAKIVTSAKRYQKEGWFTRGAKNLLLLSQYFLGQTPEKLAKNYEK